MRARQTAEQKQALGDERTRAHARKITLKRTGPHARWLARSRCVSHHEEESGLHSSACQKCGKNSMLANPEKTKHFPRCLVGFLDTFPVNMATPTPENRAKLFLRKQGSIAMMMPAFMPVEKIDMGLHVELTSRNEHMVTTIDPGSPASQEGTMRRPSRGTDSP